MDQTIFTCRTGTKFAMAKTTRQHPQAAAGGGPAGAGSQEPRVLSAQASCGVLPGLGKMPGPVRAWMGAGSSLGRSCCGALVTPLVTTIFPRKIKLDLCLCNTLPSSPALPPAVPEVYVTDKGQRARWLPATADGDRVPRGPETEAGGGEVGRGPNTHTAALRGRLSGRDAREPSARSDARRA